MSAPLSASALASCTLCPRACSAARVSGQTGVCRQGAQVRLARAALHFWEEPPISAQAGSGTVFFSGCPLHCVYCQNASIADGSVGREVSVRRLAQIFLELQARGANNINLVTPTHFVPQVCEALDAARSGQVRPREEVLEDIAEHTESFPFARLDVIRLELPIVYNTGGYESVETIEALAGHVDVFLTDFKYASSEVAARYSHAPDYPQAASVALDAMFKLVGEPRFTLDSAQGVYLMQRGVIVRHLLLPDNLADSFAVMRLLAAKPYAPKLWLSLMSQYTPMPGVGQRFPELARDLDEDDYLALVDYALELGFENSFMQEGGAAEESFIPAFDYEGV